MTPNSTNTPQHQILSSEGPLEEQLPICQVCSQFAERRGQPLALDDAMLTTDQLVASGFNRLHVSNSAGSALKEELYVNNVTDRVNAVGVVFLGLTLGCAACHDHKFDPITQREYYQLFAFFNNLDGPPDNKGHKSPEPSLAVPTQTQQGVLVQVYTVSIPPVRTVFAFAQTATAGHGFARL